jgi:hypothetical protein
MTESLFLALLVGSTSVWVFAAMSHAGWRELRHGALIGLILALASYVRPAAVYLPVFFAFVTLASGKGSIKQRLQFGGAILLVVVLAVAPWTARNWRLYRVPDFSTVGTEVAVYYFAAGVYRVHFGISDLREAQHRLEIDYKIPSVAQVHDFWSGPADLADTRRRLKHVPADVVRRYPWSTLNAIAISIPMGLLAHSIRDISRAAGSDWNNPELANVLTGRFRTFTRRLVENSSSIVLFFMFQTAMSLFTCLGVLIGIAKFRYLQGAQLRLWCGIVILALPGIAAIVLQGTTPEDRMRLSLLPYAAMLAGLGWTAVPRANSPAAIVDSDT